MPLGQKLDQLLERGTPDEVDAQIARIEALISTSPAPPPPAAAGGGPVMPVPVDVRPIPAGAAIIFWSVRYDPTRPGPTLGPSELYTMNADGGNVTRLTFNNPQPYEHAAVSFDRRMIAADRYLKSGTGPAGCGSSTSAKDGNAPGSRLLHRRQRRRGLVSRAGSSTSRAAGGRTARTASSGSVRTAAGSRSYSSLDALDAGSSATSLYPGTARCSPTCAR